MPLLLLIRHGENDFTKKGKLAGHTPGVHLNERGQEQAQALADALKNVPIKAIYSSPLERAMETASPIAEVHNLTIIQEPGLIESFVGKWQGRSWKALRLTKAWKIVQRSPSRFRFPEGESFPEMQTRVASALDGILRKHKPQDMSPASSTPTRSSWRWRTTSACRSINSSDWDATRVRPRLYMWVKWALIWQS